jgi:hypothetical protein
MCDYRASYSEIVDAVKADNERAREFVGVRDRFAFVDDVERIPKDGDGFGIQKERAFLRELAPQLQWFRADSPPPERNDRFRFVDAEAVYADIAVQAIKASPVDLYHTTGLYGHSAVENLTRMMKAENEQISRGARMVYRCIGYHPALLPGEAHGCGRDLMTRDDAALHYNATMGHRSTLYWLPPVKP